ncbi:MAG: hypothetical protein D6741_09975 [Planctomycetota bacterium]|nr:MAG: hypothetical protein D6741_09975 [Planctomycetota bacterium]
MLCGTAFQAARAQDDGMLEMIVPLLSSPDTDMRALAWEQVRTGLPGKEATLALVAELEKLEPDAQIGLLRALADRKDKAARDGILALYKSTKNDEVRIEAAIALSYLGGNDEVPLFLELAKSEDTRETALGCLRRLQGDTVTQQIVHAAGKVDPNLGAQLIAVLAERRAIETVPSLLDLAVCATPELRKAAMQSLSELAGPEVIPQMARGVLRASPGPEREAAEKCLAAVAQRISDPNRRARPLLEAMLPMESRDQLALLPCVGRIGGKLALQIVLSAVEHPSPKAHDVGVTALCNWPDSSPADELIDLYLTDEHDVHKRRALRALIRIAPLPDGRSEAERLALLKRVLELCRHESDKRLAVARAGAIRSIETLRFLMPLTENEALREDACFAIVELAHHRDLREPNKEEFDAALDRVIEVAKDPIVVQRAQTYKKGETWGGPKRSERK